MAHPNRAPLKSAYGELIGTVDLQKLLNMVTTGQAIKHRVAGGKIEFQLTAPRVGFAPSRGKGSFGGNTSIIASEMAAIAGLLYPRSRGDRHYLPSIGRIQEIKNFVDHAHSKFEEWPFVGDTKAVRVGPRAAT